jgi:enamine deaminase RidA (YjgF/YER057c/UK114 family)
MIQERLRELGIELPDLPMPTGNYVSARQVGDLVFLGGAVPTDNGVQQYKGKVGLDLTLEQAYDAARLCALNHLSTLQAALGDLDRIDHFVKVIGYVNAAPGFTQIPKVINGASDLFVDVFGDAGRHVRLALGIAEIDEVFPVETEVTVRIRN